MSLDQGENSIHGYNPINLVDESGLSTKSLMNSSNTDSWWGPWKKMRSHALDTEPVKKLAKGNYIKYHTKVSDFAHVETISHVGEQNNTTDTIQKSNVKGITGAKGGAMHFRVRYQPSLKSSWFPQVNENVMQYLKCANNPTSGCPPISKKDGDTLLKSACGTDFQGRTILCKDWCMKNPGQCNMGSKAYCEKKPEDIYCSCIKDQSGLGIDNYCYDGNCKTSGYKETAETARSCPPLTICKQSVECNAKDGNCNFDHIDFVNKCGGNPVDHESPDGEPLDKDTNEVLDTNETHDIPEVDEMSDSDTLNMDNNGFGLIFWIFIVSIIMAIVVAAYQNKVAKQEEVLRNDFVY